MAEDILPDNPNKPNQIDVSLSLVGSDSKAELAALTLALSQLKNVLAQVAAPSAQAANTLALGGQTSSSTRAGKASESASTGTQAAQTNAEARAAGSSEQATAEMPPIETVEQEARQRLNFVGRGSRKANKRQRELEEAEARRVDNRQDDRPIQSGADTQAQQDYETTSGRPGEAGTPSRGGGGGGNILPPDASHITGGDVPGWMGTTTEATLNMPRFGEYTSQELLARASDAAISRATKQFSGSVKELMEGGATQEEAQAAALKDGVGNFSGGVGRALAFGSRKMPYLAAAERISDYGTSAAARAGIDISTGSLQQIGAQMGQNTPQWDYNPLPFGPTLNFDAPHILQPFLSGGSNKAFREKFSAGFEGREFKNISSAKRQELFEEAVAHGRSYDDSHINQFKNAAYRALNKPGLQAMSASTFGQMFDQDLRHGQTSMDQFVKSVRDIPAAARAARMSTEEYAQALIGVGEQFSNSMGATANKGRQYGSIFSTATGADPALGGKLLQNPLVQGQLMRETQVLPNAQGNLDPATLFKATSNAVKMIHRTYKGQFEDKIQKHKWGNTVVTDEEQAIAATQSMFPEMSIDQIKDYLGGVNSAGTFTELQAVSAKNSAQMADAAKSHDSKRLNLIRHGGLVQEKNPANAIASNAEVIAAMHDAKFSPAEIKRAMAPKFAANRDGVIKDIVQQHVSKTNKSKDEGRTKVDVDVQLGFSKPAQMWVDEISRKTHTSTAASNTAKGGGDAANQTKGDQVKPYTHKDTVTNDSIKKFFGNAINSLEDNILHPHG